MTAVLKRYVKKREKKKERDRIAMMQYIEDGNFQRQLERVGRKIEES